MLIMQCPECQPTPTCKNDSSNKKNNFCADCGYQFMAQYLMPKTLSQKLYQLQALEIAEEFEQALDCRSLAKIKKLLEKVLEDTSS